MRNDELVFVLSRAMRDAGIRSGLGTLDRCCRSILEYIGELEVSGEAVQVKTVVGSGLFGTAPTVISKLDHLLAAGWIEKFVDPEDFRARRLVLTKQARRAFSKMSGEMEKLVPIGASSASS